MIAKHHSKISDGIYIYDYTYTSLLSDIDDCAVQPYQNGGDCTVFVYEAVIKNASLRKYKS